jgi:hypothetical protein
VSCGNPPLGQTLGKDSYRGRGLYRKGLLRHLIQKIKDPTDDMVVGVVVGVVGGSWGPERYSKHLQRSAAASDPGRIQKSAPLGTQCSSSRTAFEKKARPSHQRRQCW